MKAQFLKIPVICREFNRTIKQYPMPITRENLLLPPEGAVKLAEVPKEPTYKAELGEDKFKTNRRYIDARGVEEIHNYLIYKQFGLAVVQGGFMLMRNFQYLTTEINKNLRADQFAVWRVDPPWLPRTMRQMGKKRGGGKPGIKYYVTPVRAKRVIVEVGGAIDEDEARCYLESLITTFRFPVEFISQRILDERAIEEENVRKNNKNKFDWETVIKWNMQNCSSFLNNYDMAWKGKYR